MVSSTYIIMGLCIGANKYAVGHVHVLDEGDGRRGPHMDPLYGALGDA